MRKTYLSPAIKVISLEDFDELGYNINSETGFPQWSRKKELDDYWESEETEYPFPWEEEKEE